MSAPTITVEAAFGVPPLQVPTADQWTDLSPYVRGASIRRGKSHELEQMQAGELTLRLDNSDGRFDPSAGDWNLIPLQNQRDVEVALGSNQFVAISGATVVRTTTAGQFNQGIAGLSVTAHATNTFSGATVGASTGTTNCPAVVGGRTYAFSVYAKGSGAHTYILRARWLDSGGTAISNSDSSSLVASTGSFRRDVLVATAPSTAAFVRFQILFPSGGATQVLYLDQFQVERGSGASTWPGSGPRVMNRVRLRATVGANTYDLFQGYVEDWGQEWVPRPVNAAGSAQASVHAVDAFKVLNLFSLSSYPDAVLADEPILYYRFAEPAGSPTALNEGSLSDLSGYPLSYGSTASLGAIATPLFGGATALDITGVDAALGPVESTSVLPGLIGATTVEAWVRIDTLPVARGYFVEFQGDADVLSQSFVAGVLSTGNPLFVHGYKDSQFRSVTFSFVGATLSTNTWYHLAFVRDPSGSNVECFVNGSSVGVAWGPHATSVPAQGRLRISGDPTGLDVDGKLAHLAIYDKTLSAAQIAAHYAHQVDAIGSQFTGAVIGQILDAVGWPAGARSLDAGMSRSSEFRPEGGALPVLQQVAEATEDGLLYVLGDGRIRFVSRQSLQASQTALASLGDGPGEVNYDDLELRNDDQDVYSQVVVGREGGSDVFAADATAASAYGPRTLERSGLLLSTELEQIDRANGLLNRYKTARTRPESLELDLASDDARMDAVLAREIGDRVSVLRRPPGGGTISVAALIEGISHEISATRRIVTTWALAPAPPAPWILGDSTYGVLDSTTILGY